MEITMETLVGLAIRVVFRRTGLAAGISLAEARYSG